WRTEWAAYLGAFLVLVPSAQIVVSWSICWPHLLAAELAVAAFVLAEIAYRRAGPLRPLGTTGALVLLLIAAWIYQSNALFYLVLVVGGVFTERRKSLRGLSRWLAWHAAVL